MQGGMPPDTKNKLGGQPPEKKTGVCTVLHVSARRHTAQHKPGGEPPETNRHAPNIFDTDTAERNGMPEATSRPNTAHLNGMHDKPRRQAARRTSSVRRDVVFSPNRRQAEFRRALHSMTVSVPSLLQNQAEAVRSDCAPRNSRSVIPFACACFLCFPKHGERSVDTVA